MGHLSWRLRLVLVLFLLGFALPGLKAQGYTAPDRSFLINFPGVPVAKEQLVETQLGQVPMKTYLFEASEQLVFLAAISDFPEDSLSKIAPDSLLKNTMLSIQVSLGIDSLEGIQLTKKDEYPGRVFRGHSRELWVVYELYLLNSRLYQIAMLSGSGYPLDKDIEDYFGSFELLEGAFVDGNYHASPNAGFKVAFPKKPTASTQSLPREGDPVLVHLFISEVENQGVYMVSYSDQPSDSGKTTDTDALLKRAEISILKNLGLPRPERSGSINLEEHPGIYFQAASMQMRASFRIFLVNKRLYQVGVMAPVGFYNQQAASKFLESFRLEGNSKG